MKHRFWAFAIAAAALMSSNVFAQTPPPAPAPAPPAGIHYLYLIRHGIYDPERNADDVTGNGLNATGHEQARLAGERLAALPVSFASIATSNYRRARETAEDIARVLSMPPVQDTLIHECSPRADRAEYMRNHSSEEIAACDSNLVRAWGKYFVPTPDADRHEILVCHSNVVRWFASRVVSGDASHWTTMEIGNGSITIIAIRPDGSPRLVTFSDVGHLPVAKQTWTGKGAGWGSAPKK